MEASSQDEAFSLVDAFFHRIVIPRSALVGEKGLCFCASSFHRVLRVTTAIGDLRLTLLRCDLDARLVAQLPVGIDACGENGEF
ncbi:MAG: hypothetical protein ACRD59_00450, partial [Candidatus Acidiferrales bacterium]